MAYCRWSSMDWACDIYAYESVGDFWAIHVAWKRRVHPDPCPTIVWPTSPKNDEAELKLFRETKKAQDKWLEEAELVEIDLPHAGEDFDEDTLEEFRDRLLMLREIGYIMPDYVFEVIEKEIKERDNG